MCTNKSLQNAWSHKGGMLCIQIQLYIVNFNIDLAYVIKHVVPKLCFAIAAIDKSLNMHVNKKI